MLTKDQITQQIQEINKSTGVRLYKLRRTHDLSQTQVAAEISLVPNHVSAIEMGNKGIDSRKLMAFAKLYGVTTDFILTGNKDGLSAVAKSSLDGSDWFS